MHFDTNCCELPDGRSLAFAEYGLAQGQPVLYLHGLPASRLEAAVLHAAAQNLGARLIAPERPGFGQSSVHVNRTLLSWVDDLIVLANALGIDRFAVIGMSAGGPYAFACAYALNGRVTSIATIGALGPCYQSWAVRDLRLHGRLAFLFANHAPGLLWPTYGLFTSLAMRHATGMTYQVVAAAAAPADRAALNQPFIKAVLTQSMIESMSQGPDPALQELKLLARPWGFAFDAAQVPVTLWHGTVDQVVPLSHADYYARVMPGIQVRVLDNEGHFSLPINHARAILQSVLV